MHNKQETVIDVEYASINSDNESIMNDVYVTMPYIAQKIGVSSSRVYHWSDEFGDIIDKLNNNESNNSNGNRKRYRESNVKTFALIKDLIDTQHFSHEQVRTYLIKQGEEYSEYDSGLINPKDPLGFQALASALTIEVKEQLNMFSLQLTNEITTQVKELLNQQNDKYMQINTEMQGSVDDIISEKVNEISETIAQSVKDMNNSVSQVNNSIQTLHKNNKNRDIILVNKLKQSMENTQQEYLNELKLQSHKKSLFSKIFEK